MVRKPSQNIELFLDKNLSDEEFESRILEYGIDYKFGYHGTLINYFMYTEEFEELSYSKIDIIFKYKPSIYLIFTDKFTGIRYIDFQISFNYILYPSLGSSAKSLYIFIKILQLLDLKLITHTKILESLIELEDEGDEEGFNYPVMKIYGYSLLHFIELFYKNHENCFNINYFILRFLIFNEIERKKSLSNIIFSKIIN